MALKKKTKRTLPTKGELYTQAQEKFILKRGKQLIKKKGYTKAQAMRELTEEFNDRFDAKRSVAGIIRKFSRLIESE